MKKLSVLLVFVIIVLLGFIIYEKRSFSIKYKVCDINHSNCLTVARFKDMNDCKTTEEKWSWYCDTVKNPLKPDCRVEKSTISTSFCSE